MTDATDDLIEHLVDVERRLTVAFAKAGVDSSVLNDMRLLSNAAVELRRLRENDARLDEENDRLIEWGRSCFDAGFQERQRAERAEAEVVILRNDLATYAERIAALEAERADLIKINNGWAREWDKMREEVEETRKAIEAAKAYRDSPNAPTEEALDAALAKLDATPKGGKHD